MSRMNGKKTHTHKHTRGTLYILYTCTRRGGGAETTAKTILRLSKINRPTPVPPGALLLKLLELTEYSSLKSTRYSTTNNFIHLVESPYVLVVKRKCIYLYHLQYCNLSCVLD